VRILIIGGTVFAGRHFCEAALSAGHDVTLFHRGRHNPGLFPTAEFIQGDRTADLGLLRDSWDVVLDTCGYFPRDVSASAEHLKDKAGRYVFVSSLSVYAESSTTPGIDETRKLLTANPDDVEVTGENYGGLKALCEDAAERAMPGRVLVIRPGLIVGPHDQSDRFTYWAVRLNKGGNILAPGPPDDPVQLIDVRDLAEWILRLAEEGKTGTFNANGPDYELTMERALLAGLSVADQRGRLVWVDGAWLREQGVTPWTEMPLWVPDAIGFARFDSSKAIEAGLTFRSVEQTFAETRDWAVNRPNDYEWRAGMKPEREVELISLWSAGPQS